ncbi:hypothetical protein F8388_020439 [Cannabis sativa]|uniref:Aminotransferase-like plant mobile domain-containing protein n=1 Tax=Cannabis sativa TaxID=3483 RepID=A0A7J6HH53_CANSA|nr:hypothetical protein F8388_020439 [Cannabis sativa]
MGKRKKTSSNSESLPQAKNNIFLCEHSMAPLLRRDLFPRILETDGIYLYQDSMNDYIVPDGDLPLCYRYSKNDLAIEYRSRSGVMQGWKGWISSVATRFSTLLSSAKILSPMLASSDLEIYRVISSLDQLVSYWSKATHTFIVNWGEFTITLEDVYALLLLPICGTTSLVSPLSNDEQSLLSSLTLAVEDLKKRYMKKKQYNLLDWVRYFHQEDSQDLVELASCIALWLSRYIFPSKTSRRTVQSAMFPLACRLAYGKHFPLGAAYLGTLYHNLDSIINDANSYSENKEVISSIDACFLQMFIWERFPKLAPIRKSLQPGEPRPWAWVSSKCWKTLCNVTKDVSNFTFRPYLTNNCTYFTLDMYPGSVVPLTDEVRSSFTTSAGEAGFWFVVCLPRSLLCLRDDPKSLSWSFVSYRPDHREGGVSVKFANIWMRHHCTGLISQGETCDREKGVGPSSGVYIPLQKSPPLAPSEVCLVDERHTPVALVGKPSDALGGNSHGNAVAVRPNSEPRPFHCSGTNGDSDATTNLVITRYPLVPSSSSSTFQSTITHGLAPTTAPLKMHATYTDRSSPELCLPAPPSGLLAAGSMHVSLERSEDLTTLVGRDSIHLSSHESHASQTHATDTNRSTHELCLLTPPSNLLGASSTYVRLERSEDLTTLVGRDAIHLSSYEPQASQFYSRYTSIDKDFASFFKGLSQSEKILFIQLITPVLPLLQFEYAVSETYCSLLSENWRILCLVFPKQPPILKTLIESYLETVRSSIRHCQLVEELNTLREARKDLDHKIESLAEHIRDRDPPPSTWTHVPL